jgi:hypothetical protein
VSSPEQLFVGNYDEYFNKDDDEGEDNEEQGCFC